MSTFGDLKADVARDLRRSDLTSEIATAVLASIRYHGKERFYFNETRTYSLTLTNGTDEYSITSAAPVQEFVEIDWIRVLNGSTYERMLRVDPDCMEELFSTTQTASVPDSWTYYADKIRVYPTPSTSGTARIAGHYRLIDLSADSDSNAWTNAAKDLIRYSALTRLYIFPIRDTAKAQMAKEGSDYELQCLRAETDKRKRTGQMAAYY